ncbi:glycosyltransferase [Ktedonosporobacter rubrisoli]|nr:glycosyltransferase [Ktedonosporobacter rubrisoli]
MNGKVVVVAWAKHSRRAETLATELGGRLSLQYERRLKGLWLTPLRYIVQGWKTWHFLEQESPEIIVIQAPPVFAALTIALWCKLRAKVSNKPAAYVVDCHSGSFYSRWWTWTIPIQRFLSQRALVTLVASEDALDTLKRWRARGIFLVDGLPELSGASGDIGTQGDARIAVISSFDYDEPLYEIFAAARLLPRVAFYLSGDPQRLPPKLLKQKPENAILTGFLPEDLYSGLLQNVHGLMVLTTEPNILNCGAYEALAMAKPVVVSDWPQMRRCFTRGFIYVKNTPEAIATGVKKMLAERETLTHEIILMRSELMMRRQSWFAELIALLEQRRTDGLATIRNR